MLADFQTLAAALTRDDAGKISADDADGAISLAVTRYSKDRPRAKVEDVAAPGGKLLPLPASWEAGFSALSGLEYPVGDVPPSMIGSQAWAMYNAPGGMSIMVFDSIPVGAAVRASYGVAHQVSGVTDTVPPGDREAVCCLAAASLCDQLASLYSGDTDSTIGADSVNHQSKAAEFAARAKALRKRYHDELGIDDRKNVAAGVVVDLDLSSSLGGDRLGHGIGYRGSRRGR
ncbi:MAG: hypothetical protein FD134_1863 [Gallionellaceae bacterium]|nr:MAG: hypothetical protein FD134_1863 [Gallionellaceae bacterium]